MLAESLAVPAEIVAGVAALLGAAAYAVRKVVASRPSAAEDASAVTLEGLRTTLREVRQVKAMLARCHGCAWAEGEAPKAWQERVERLRLEIDQDAARRKGGRGGGA